MNKPILVTGAHRSGSTWIGKIISQAPNIRYIHEPFNINISRANQPFTDWFKYLDNASQDDYEEATDYLRSFYYILNISNFKNLFVTKSIREFLYFFYDLKNRLTHKTLFKDPIAIMSAEWMYKNLNCDIVISIRHPAAFIASLKVKNWEFDFNNFSRQEYLMKNYLKEYTDIVNEYSNNKKNIIEQGILLWNIIYSTVIYYQEKYDDKWLFIKHEDLSMNPLSEFNKVFNFLNINFNDNVRDFIIQTTTAKESTDLKRDSKSNIKTWKQRLTTSEIDLIKKETENVWKEFYTEKDW